MIPRCLFSCTVARLTIILSLLLLLILTPCAPAQPVTDEAVHLACVLIIDTSGSMESFYDEVRATAVDIAGQFESGDVISLITFDSTVTNHPLVTILDSSDAGRLGDQIAALEPRGTHTYIAGALEAARIEADRLDDAPQYAEHNKLVFILTDGRNEPPPGLPDGKTLTEVAEQFEDRPWYFWQMQLGPEGGEDLHELIRSRIRGGNVEKTHVIDIDSLREQMRKKSPSWISITPGSIDLGTREPGDVVPVTLSYKRRNLGGTADVGLVDGGSEQISVSMSPASWQSSPGESGEIVLEFRVADDAPEGAVAGEILTRSDLRTIHFSPMSLHWEAEIFRSEVTRISFGRGEVDFGRVATGSSATRRLPVDVSGSVPGLGMALSVSDAGVAGVTASIGETRVSLAEGDPDDVRLTLEVTEDAALGIVTGEVRAAFSGASVELAPAAVAWRAEIVEPFLLWPWLVGAGVLVVAVLLLVAWRRRPVLNGTLTYWAPSGGEGRINLSDLGAGRALMGSASNADIPLEEADATAGLVATRIEGDVLVVVTPEQGTGLVHEGRETSSLALYDRDEFRFGGYTFEYRGDVPVRPTDETSEW